MNPKELLIKVAQMLPDSDVIIGKKELLEGNEKISEETMVTRLYQQLPIYEKDDS